MTEEQPVTIRVYPGELRSVYYTSVLAFHSTQTLEVIRLSLERLQIYEDKSLYELYQGKASEDKDQWTKMSEADCPVALQVRRMQAVSREQETRFFLRRKEHASLVLADIVSQYISPEVNEGRIQDMCDLDDFSEQDMLSNLRARFSNKDIYTYVGSILISINPYYFYSIYNPKYGSMYQGTELGSLPPHVFAVADSSYHTMLGERQNQSVIISGESGAGKTEATKFLLHHLMNLSAKLDDTQSLELITLGIGPVLEVFIWVLDTQGVRIRGRGVGSALERISPQTGVLLYPNHWGESPTLVGWGNISQCGLCHTYLPTWNEGLGPPSNGKSD